MMQQLRTVFSPLHFLASLGAGGIAVAFFAFINYTLPHGPGLIDRGHTQELAEGARALVYAFAEVGIIVFALLHVLLTLALIVVLVEWLRQGKWRELWNDPLKNAVLVAPLISLTMTMNVIIGPVRYFIPTLADNLQAIMLPGLIVWGALWLITMVLELALLQVSFVKGFDVQHIHFGWLLHPFVLGMVTVTGAGIAALSTDKGIADTAAFMSLVSGLMGVFLLSTKLHALFERHFAGEGLPAKQFLPSLLIVIPNITLFAISGFRLAHWLEHHHGAELHAFMLILMVGALAFETWYLAFGSLLLKDYFGKELKDEFHVSQWGLVCPYVAYAVLTAFVFALFVPTTVMFWWGVFLLVVLVWLFVFLLRKQLSCLRTQTRAGVSCS
jgi:hypothetical protein